MRDGVIGVIPARWDSVRFPGKALATILGRPMLQHVYEAARACRLINQILIATDDERIATAAENFGARVVMTSREHCSGTDRVAEAVSNVARSFVVNIQGDEPLLRSESIDKLVSEMTSDPTVEMATLACRIADETDLASPSCAKVVLDKKENALYFSRSRIPYVVGDRPFDFYRHIGVYGYRRDVLDAYLTCPPSPLEIAEGLEQLRALEQGFRIRVIRVDGWGPGVDTPEDIERV
ncbi:MAG: 3-deoxy-manno-octulosonate cytidylyltransferase, partial [bacterium]